jgi:hypothetical protein
MNKWKSKPKSKKLRWDKKRITAKKRSASAKSTYALYLESEHWKAFKKSKEAVEPKKCRACGDVKLVHLHHMIYRKPLESAELDDTCWLCQGCHKKFHERADTTLKNVLYVNLLAETIRVIGKPFDSSHSPWGAAFSKNPTLPRVKQVKHALGDFLPGDRVIAPECKMKMATVMAVIPHGRKGRMMVQIKWDPCKKQQHGKTARMPPERLLKAA